MQSNNILKNISFDKVSYLSLLTFAFTLPLSRAAISFFIFWFVILVIIKRDYKNSFIILKENKIFLYLGLFLLYVSLTALWSLDIESSLKHIRLYGYWIIIPCIYILAQKEWIYKILNAFLLGMFISEILAYGIFFDLWSINGSTPEYPSPFMTHIHYSVFLAFTSLVLLYRFLFETRSIMFKIPMFLFFCMTTTNLMISTGRTGQLAFFIALFVVFIIKYKLTIKTFFLSTVFLIMILSISYNTLDLFKQRADAAIYDVKNIFNHNFNTSFGIRAAWWILSYDALKEKPILGHGLGSHKIVAKEMVEKYDYSGLTPSLKEYLYSSHYHNQYLMIVVESGILGLFLFFIFIYKFLLLKIKDIEIKHMSILGIVVLLVSFVGDPMLFLQFPLVLFLFIVSLALIASKKDDNRD